MAIGVWFKTEHAKLINILGTYNFKGDFLHISGTFNKACKLHLGEMDF
jgi:hypothetical protein